MQLRIETSGSIPIYLQIVEQIKRSIALGMLLPQSPLPSVRQLAVELIINPNTVARAYLELEQEGVIYKRQGQGTFVSPGAAVIAQNERRKAVAAMFEKALEEAESAGLSPPEIENLFERSMRRRYRTVPVRK